MCGDPTSHLLADPLDVPGPSPYVWAARGVIALGSSLSLFLICPSPSSPNSSQGDLGKTRPSDLSALAESLHCPSSALRLQSAVTVTVLPGLSPSTKSAQLLQASSGRSVHGVAEDSSHSSRREWPDPGLRQEPRVEALGAQGRREGSSAASTAALGWFPLKWPQ